MDTVRGLPIVAAEIRRRGWGTVFVPGWESRGTGGRPIVPKGAVNHWTAGSRSGNAPSLNVVTFGRAGLRNALCHTYQDRSRTLYIVAARIAWHAGAGSWPGLRGNADCLGHEPECSGPGDWRPGQLELMADLDAVQADVFGYPLGRIIDHFEWTSRKVDRTDVGGQPWRARLAVKAQQPTVPKPTPSGDLTIGEFMATLTAAQQRRLTALADVNPDAVADLTKGLNAADRTFLFALVKNARAEHPDGGDVGGDIGGLTRHLAAIGSSVQGLVRGGVGFIRRARTDLGWKLPTE